MNWYEFSKKVDAHRRAGSEFRRSRPPGTLIKRNSTAWQTYRSYKIVRAARILWIETHEEKTCVMLDNLEGSAFSVEVADSLFARGIPAPGDYLVVYDDGYTSWSPAKAFLEGYRPTSEKASLNHCFDLGTALQVMKTGGLRVGRKAWSSNTFLIHVPGSLIEVQEDRPLGRAAPELCGLTVEYAEHYDIYVPGFGLSPWSPGQNDLVATDYWVLPIRTNEALA